MSVLVVTGERAFPVAIPSQAELVVGSGVDADVKIADSKVAARQVALRLGADGLVEVRDLNTAGTLVNDVQLSGMSSVRAGDQITMGDSLLLIQAAGERLAAGPRLVPHRDFEGRLSAEVARSRAHRRPLALLLVQLPGAGDEERGLLLRELSAKARSESLGFTWGDFGGDILELLCPEASAAALEELKDRTIAALGSRGRRFKLGQAQFPDDGADAEELLESALARMVESWGAPSDEPVQVDPVMVRLVAILERLAHGQAPLLFEGPPGAGKQTLARLLCRHQGEGSEFRHLRCAVLSESDLEDALAQARSGERVGVLYLDRLEDLSPGLQQKLAASTSMVAGARLVGSAVNLHELRPELVGRFAGTRVVVPALADRPADVLPLADHFLAQGRRVLERPALSFSGEARRILDGYGWPANVRELKNAVKRAMLVATGSEIGADELPARVVAEASSRGGGAVGGLRASMRSAEKEVLLRALAATGWNVTAAARQLGLPRRTVIYRMSRLGLQRPKK